MKSEDEIAIVGIACHFPGGDGIDNFWQVLVEGRNCTVEIPPERFSTREWYDPDPNKPGKIVTTRAALLDGFNTFDNKLFGIHDMEAARMDPQQKLLLECTYRALEDAGIPTEDISGTKTGVFVGLMNRDYEIVSSGAVNHMNHYDGTGVAVSINANRISYAFNLTGPSLAIDTACSSFLYALHCALNAIKQGDCEAALCGGVSCIIDPRTFVSLSKAKMISPDGLSKPFSKEADGYGRGEGCGVILLKPLKKAQEDFNKIWGVIRISAINQDGRSATPITKPSQEQQENLLLSVYPTHIDPSELQYIEAHGTGTPIGDPTEAESLGNAIGKKRSPKVPPLKMGSVKGNIGHTESAAGAAGLIKVLLMMHHGKMVPSLHFSESNSSINTKQLNLSIPTTVETWEEPGDLGRVAGINCFGFGGTNAHVVVRQVKQAQVLPAVKRPVELFVISAASGCSLKRTMEDTAGHIRASASVTLPSLAYTSACRRSHRNYKYRKAFVASSLQHLEQQLRSAAGMDIVPSKRPPQLVFVFSGNGLNLKGVFTTLLKAEPVFRDKCQEIERLFQKYSPVSLLKVAGSEQEDLTRPEIAQPLLFTLQVALVTLLQYWGVTPTAAVGHSVGEVAAAHCAGYISLEDAVKVVYHRSRLQATVTGGRMLVVGNVPVEEVSGALGAYSGKVCIAAFNSPQSCTLSGDAESISALQKELGERFRERNVFLHALNVPAAYHSQMMDPILQEIEESLLVLGKQKPELEVFSTVTGKVVSDEFFVGRYWARQVRDPVFFADAIMTSVKDKENVVFVEVSPQGALWRYVIETLGKQIEAFPSLQMEKEYETLLKLVKGLFELGFNPDWKHIFDGYQSAPSPYPRYHFDRKSHMSYLEYRTQQAQEAANFQHPLLQNINNDNTEFKCSISQALTPYLYEHKHNGVALVPGACFVELALAAAMSTRPKVPLCQMSMKFTSPCVLSESSHELKLIVESQETVKHIKILSSSGALFASGQVTRNPEISLEERSISIKDVLQRCTSLISRDEIYETLSFAGFQYGSTFKQLSGAFYCEELKEVITIMKVDKQTTEEMHEYFIHPVLLDCFLQMTVVMIAKTFKNRIGFPSGISSLVIVRPLEEEMAVYLKTSKSTENYLEFCGCFTDKHGSVLVEIKRAGITFVKETSMQETNSLFENKWREVSHSQMIQKSGEAPRVAVFANKNGVSRQLRRYLHKDSAFFMYDDWEKLMETKSPESAAQDRMKLEVQGYSDVLFLWGIQRLREDNPEGVVAHLSKCCEAFRQLIMVLREKKSHCSITIITYRTTEKNVDHINPGFALCGMARTCMIEASDITFQMIDLSSTSAMDMSALADVLVEYEAEKYPEVWIDQGRIYTSEVRHSEINSTSHSCHSQPLQNTAQFSLYTSEPHEARDVFAEWTDNGHVPLENHSVEVEVEKISIHSEDFFPVSVSSWNFGNTLYWSSQTIDKHQLIALDCSGTVVATGCKVDQLKVGDHIVSCYPAVASSRLNLPETVCFNTQKLSCFKTVPCVSFFRIAWEILHQMLPKLKRNGFLGIISTEPESVLCQVLTLSAQKAGWKIICTKLDSSLEQCVAHCNALIFLPPFERLPKDVLPHLFHLQDVVVVCGNHQAEKLTPLMGSSPENIQIHVLNIASIFQKASLKLSHKAFSRWMKSLQLKQLKNISCSVFQQTENCNGPLISHFTCTSVPVALLKGDVHNRCISDIPVYEAKGKLFKQNAVYIVAGGLTGLGFETVRFIAQNGGGCIAILSRRKPSVEQQQQISTLQNQYDWSRIVSLQCNITVGSDVTRAINSIHHLFPNCPIKGVFHSAVVLHDGRIEALTISNFEEVLGPKVAGAIHLHHATQGQGLDYFVCYSSVSSFLGNSMQANYAAANSFLDLFCHYRRNCGLAGQSINWSALNLGILQNQNQLQALLEARGLEILQVDDFHEYLKRSLILNNPQQAVIRLNIKNFIAQNPKLRYRMNAISTEVFGSNFQVSKQTMFSDLAPVKPEDYILSLMSQISGTDRSDIAMNTSISSLGIDSMLAMTLRNCILQERRVDIPVVKLLDPHTTVLSLAVLLDGGSQSVQERSEREYSEKENIEGGSWSAYL